VEIDVFSLLKEQGLMPLLLAIGLGYLLGNLRLFGLPLGPHHRSPAHWLSVQTLWTDTAAGGVAQTRQKRWDSSGYPHALVDEIIPL
jgi:hypothetical protein